MKILSLASMVFASIAYGQSPIRVTITTNDGTVYENARITSDTDSELIIINKDGANTIPKSKLSDADKVRFNYDPEKEKVLIAKRDEAAEHWKQSQTEQEKAQYVQWVRRAATEGDTYGCLLLSSWYGTGKAGCTKDPEVANYWLRKGSDLGSAADRQAGQYTQRSRTEQQARQADPPGRRTLDPQGR